MRQDEQDRINRFRAKIRTKIIENQQLLELLDRLENYEIYGQPYPVWADNRLKREEKK